MEDMAKITLNNGVVMPMMGLGTCKVKESGILEVAVFAALKAGYQLFDSAVGYNNEIALGKAIRKCLEISRLKRSDLFITTKLAPSNLGEYQIVNAAYQRSIDNLGIGYADLCLIHFPGGSKTPSHEECNKKLRRSAWQALSRIYDEGRVNAIGVTNFTVQHLKDLEIKTHEVMPTVNQVEWNPYNCQEELRAYCRANDICLQAYGSFGGASSGDKTLFQDLTVKRIADNHDVGPNQVLLAWALQQNIAVIPKSVNPQHIAGNISIKFLLTEAELNDLNSLRAQGKDYAWDPTVVH